MQRYLSILAYCFLYCFLVGFCLSCGQNRLVMSQTNNKTIAVPPMSEQNRDCIENLLTQLYGTWKCIIVTQQPEDEDGPGYEASNTRILSFMKSKKFSFIEEVHGQTSPYFKEDWKFISWGTYDFIGDTINLYIEREKCDQLDFSRFNFKTNAWVHEVKPTYDSIFTNKERYKFITINDLKIDFKKSR